MTELKKCPFCGCEAQLYHSISGKIYVFCGSCGAGTKTYSDGVTIRDTITATSKAIEAWNRRAE